MTSAMFIFWMFLQMLEYVYESGPEYYTETHQAFHRFAYGALSGTMGAQNMLFAKSTSTLIILTFSPDQHGNAFFVPWTYLIVAALLFSIFFQLRWLNAGLQRF